MSENKTGKYFKYAVGEIILVVIGILIALQINNWNQNRLDHGEEKIILGTLKEDYLSAIEEFKSLNILRADVISAASEISKISSKNYQNYSAFNLDSIIGKTLSGPTFNNKSGSLDVLLTSGKINIITNRQLKKKLIEWPGDIEDMTEDEIAHNNLYLGKYSDMIDTYISWNDLVKYLQLASSRIRFSPLTVDSGPINPKVVSDYKSLLNNKEFLNVLTRRALFCSISNHETEVLINKAKEIIELIDGELKT